MNLAKKLIEASNDRKKSSFGNWRGMITESNRVKDIQKRFLTRLLMSKAGRIAEAFRTIKNLPDMPDLEQRKKAAKFEKGLSSFVDRTLRVSFGSFK